MAAHTRIVRRVREVPDDGVTRDYVAYDRPSWRVGLSQGVWFLAGLLLVLLGFRFIFAALGANPNNPFVNFIYTTSHGFVSPFFGIFSYDPVKHGISRIEIYTLVAMIVYALIATAIVALINIDRRRTVDRT